MIEVEKRGSLSANGLKHLRDYLINNAVLKSSQKQLNIFIEFDNSFLGSVENTKNSINVSFSKVIGENNINCRLKSKSGLMQSSVRKEVTIPFEFKDRNNIFDFLAVFGINTGCPRYYYREDYIIHDMNVTLKQDGLAPNHFEVDMEIQNLDEMKLAEKRINDFLLEHNLIAYSDEEYKTIMLKVFKENPPVPIEDISFDSLT